MTNLYYFCPGDLRAPCVLAIAMRSLAIVITIIQSGESGEINWREDEELKTRGRLGRRGKSRRRVTRLARKIQRAYQPPV